MLNLKSMTVCPREKTIEMIQYLSNHHMKFTGSMTGFGLELDVHNPLIAFPKVHRAKVQLSNDKSCRIIFNETDPKLADLWCSAIDLLFNGDDVGSSYTVKGADTIIKVKKCCSSDVVVALCGQ